MGGMKKSNAHATSPVPAAAVISAGQPPDPVSTEDWSCSGELVSFATAPDREGHVRRLDGFYHGLGKDSPLLLFVHGMGSNFYRSRLKKAFLDVAPVFDFSVLSFNNAGAESGTENEDFRDTLRDLDAARDFALRRGHHTLVWVGHSTGCQKITYWQEQRRPAAPTALALLAPADDHAIVRAQLGRRFDARVDWARRQVASGKPDAPVPGLYERFGARRFLSVADPRQIEAGLFRYDGPLTRFRRLTCPVLAVFGADEEFAPLPPAEMLAILRRRTRSKRFANWLIPETGHSFRDCEDALALAVSHWLSRAIAPSRKRRKASP